MRSTGVQVSQIGVGLEHSATHPESIALAVRLTLDGGINDLDVMVWLPEVLGAFGAAPQGGVSEGRCLQYVLDQTPPAAIAAMGMKSAEELAQEWGYLTATAAEADDVALLVGMQGGIDGMCLYCNHCPLARRRSTFRERCASFWASPGR